MARTVLLLHELPDGSAHHDWMLEAPGVVVDPARVLTFRIGLGQGPRGEAAFHGERLSDHRADYLTYEGPVSGGRGVVSRVISGECAVSEIGSGLRVVTRFAGVPERVWIGHRSRGGDRGRMGGWGFELADGA